MRSRAAGQLSDQVSPFVGRRAVVSVARIDTEPRLVNFGFDEDQRSGTVWGRHRKRLVEAMGERRLYAVGNTRTKTDAAFG